MVLRSGPQGWTGLCRTSAKWSETCGNELSWRAFTMAPSLVPIMQNGPVAAGSQREMRVEAYDLSTLSPYWLPHVLQYRWHREMRVLKNLNHPSIIKMHDCIDKTNHMYIMME